MNPAGSAKGAPTVAQPAPTAPIARKGRGRAGLAVAWKTFAADGPGGAAVLACGRARETSEPPDPPPRAPPRPRPRPSRAPPAQANGGRASGAEWSG